MAAGPANEWNRPSHTCIPARADTPAAGGGTGDPGLYRRRQRRLGLGVVAGLALLFGLLIGALSGGATPAHRVAAQGDGLLRAGPDAGRFRPGLVCGHRADGRNSGDQPHARLHPLRAGGRQPAQGGRADLRRWARPVHASGAGGAGALHAPATFFEVGIEERYFHASTSAIVARGYPIGDHTESHAPMSQLSMRDQQAQYSRNRGDR